MKQLKEFFKGFARVIIFIAGTIALIHSLATSGTFISACAVLALAGWSYVSIKEFKTLNNK